MGKKVTVEDDLYRSLEEQARLRDQTTEELINIALWDWLAELDEDVHVAEERVADYERTGDAVDLQQVIRERGLKC
jgi:hypothetical protein